MTTIWCDIGCDLLSNGDLAFDLGCDLVFDLGSIHSLLFSPLSSIMFDLLISSSEAVVKHLFVIFLKSAIIGGCFFKTNVFQLYLVPSSLYLYEHYIPF